MRVTRFFPIAVFPLVFYLSFYTGCAATKESESEEQETPHSEASERARESFAMDFQAASEDVRTIQLYFGEDERALPVVSLQNQRSRNSFDQLTLRFDVMGTTGRPLSAYFYHADRTWRRDLTPPEYLTSFQRDELLDFTPSRGTETPYVHYTYRFPNESIGFLLSGNYIIRITEQGREEEVLFERAFFVTEQATALEMGSQHMMVTGHSFPATVPVVQFVPPSSIEGNVFDYDVCFVRNGRFETTRCTNNAELAAQPLLRFYLEPERAFEPAASDYYLDFRDLRLGGQIEHVDLSSIPYRVTLEPDYASFPASPTAPLLNGQTVILSAMGSIAEPQLSAEYAMVGFSLVPPNETPLSSEVLITGSFNGWRYDPALRMEWVAENGRYETNVFLKQGEYEYRYHSPDRQLREHLNSAPPRSESVYHAFVYFSDLRYNTDRLLGVSGIRAR